MADWDESLHPRDKGGKFGSKGGHDAQIATAQSEVQWDLTGPPPAPLAGMTVAEWAHYFSQMDRQRIDMAIRHGLISGLDNAEIARKVVGSLQLLGIDGVTEITRRHIAQLGRIALSPRKQK